MATTKTPKKTAAPAEPAAAKPTVSKTIPGKKALAPVKPKEAKAVSKTPAEKPTPVTAKNAKTPAKQAALTPPAHEQPVTLTAAADGKWGEIQQLLLNLKQQTLLEIKRSIRKGSEASVGEEPTGDIYDQASSERDRELGLLLNDREREKLHNIDEALLRITDGEYGICEECDEEIPLGRLKVLPFTRHCVKCKSDLEKLQAQTRRIEEDRVYREIPVGEEDEG